MKKRNIYWLAVPTIALLLSSAWGVFAESEQKGLKKLPPTKESPCPEFEINDIRPDTISRDFKFNPIGSKVSEDLKSVDLKRSVKQQVRNVSPEKATRVKNSEETDKSNRTLVNTPDGKVRITGSGCGTGQKAHPGGGGNPPPDPGPDSGLVSGSQPQPYNPTGGVFGSDPDRAPLPFSLGIATGHGDYHLHQISNKGWDGRQLWGNEIGAENWAVRTCNGHDHAFSWMPGAVLQKAGVQRELGIHNGYQAGFVTPPHGVTISAQASYRDWPVWKTVVHQQAWEGWLENAHDQGLNLIVMSAVNFRFTCQLMPPGNGFNDQTGGVPPCDDMKNVRRQILAAHQFAAVNQDWYEIALDPEHARDIIHAGKLAVILQIETSEVFKNVLTDAALTTELDDYYALGVRSIQLTHELDNQFGGAAYFKSMFNLVQIINDTLDFFTGNNNAIQDLKTALNGIQLDGQDHNILGVTPLGRILIQKMIDRNMILDVAHISERGFNEFYQMSVANNYYPLVVSHTHFREMFQPDHQDEKKFSPDMIKKLKQTGGVVGLRTGLERQKTYGPAGVANNCAGSIRSYAQAYALGSQGYRIPIGFASDMNGFIEQFRPRFQTQYGRYSAGDAEDWACGTDDKKHKRVGTGADDRTAQGDRATNGLGNDFDFTGYGRIDQTQNIIDDLNNLGISTVNIEYSAESYLASWDRAYDPNRGPRQNLITNTGIDHDSLTNDCPKGGSQTVSGATFGLLSVGVNRDKVGGYAGKPVCKAIPHVKIQGHNCTSIQWNGWCIKSKDNNSWYSARKLKPDLCPVPHVKVSGSLNARILCESRPDGDIQEHKCDGPNAWGFNRYRAGTNCVVGSGSYYYRVRRLVPDLCPVSTLGKILGVQINNKIICKSAPDPTIQDHNCNGNTLWGYGRWRSGNHCVVGNNSFWYRVRTLVPDKCPTPMPHSPYLPTTKVADYNGKPVCKTIPSLKIRCSKCQNKGDVCANGYCMDDKGYYIRGRKLK